MKLKDLTISYRDNPIGLDELPKFSWKMCGEEKNLKQCFYQVIVKDKNEVVWDSGTIESDDSLFIEYKGIERRPFRKYDVKVTAFDNYGNKDNISGQFETGLLDTNNWKAKWITNSFNSKDTACPTYIKNFILKDKKIKKARLYITALGIYEVKINDKKVSENYFAPGWTSYQNRVEYQTYDVTSLLENNNLLEVTVGNGWYKGYLNGDGQNCIYGDKSAICGQVLIEYEDGKIDNIFTDETWEVKTSFIRSSEIYMGEVNDFTISEFKKEKISLLDDNKKPNTIIAQEVEPICINEYIKAKELIKTPKGELVIDFGQNIAGFVKIYLPKLSGNKLVIRHAETLDKEGNFYTDNLRSAKSVDEYIYDDKYIGKEVTPHFTYHGFRYICIEGVKDININDYIACVLHTNMKKTGAFSCNNKKINRLQENIVWSQRDNFFDIPTDCPQRDERLGWTGDAAIFSSTAMFNFNTALFYKKWLKDVALESDKIHGVPQIVPNIVGPQTGTAVWSDCATIIPWNLYMTYGDKNVLIDQYDNMKLWVEYIRRSCGDDILWLNGFQRGDWLSLDGDKSLDLMSGGTDKNLVANIYYANSTRILKDSAKILKKEEDYNLYKKLYEDIKEEINNEYVTKKGRLVSETQTACVLLLYFDLLKEEYKDRVIKTLNDNILAHKGHLTTGFVGTAYLNHALSENGLHNLAEDLLLNEEYPGWLYEVNKGATTIWERWNSILPNGDFDTSGMNSLNHYSYGSIGDWLYKKVGGISPLEKGYKKILIKPILTKGLTNVNESFESMYGNIVCNTSCENGLIKVEIEIPANTSANIILPEKEDVIEVGSGKYIYEYKTNTSLKIEKYNMNSKFKDLMNVEGFNDIANKYMPNILDGPAINYIKDKTLNELANMASGQKQLMEIILKEVNKL